MDTSSDDPIASVENGQPVILMPGTQGHTSALEQIYGKRGLPDDYKPVVDLLGRKIKEKDMPVKKGELGLFGENRVMVFRDHLLDFPELNLRVSVIGPPQDTRGFPALFTRAYCTPAKDLYDSDLVVFTGGPDVEPMYYNEEPYPTTSWSEDRDHSDIGVYMQCLDEGIPMVGVCRGAQFLAVMNGAKLFQEIDNHYGDHPIFDVKRKIQLERVSSVHHQCVRPCADMEIIAVAHKATQRWANPEYCVEGRSAELEAFYFRDTCCFGVQGHPEYKDYNGYAKWFLDYLDELVCLNEDIEWRDNHRRLKQEFIDERKLTAGLKIQKPTLAVIEGGE